VSKRDMNLMPSHMYDLNLQEPMNKKFSDLLVSHSQASICKQYSLEN